MKWLAIPLALTLGASASAQVIEGDAMKPQADAMRGAWKASPKKPVGMAIPLHYRILTFDMLRSFVPVYQAQNETSFIAEYLPDGQTFENWTEMVTVTAVTGGDRPELTHPELVDLLFNSLDGCDGSFRYRALRSASTGDVSAVVVNRSCALVAQSAYPGAYNIGEQNLIIHFRDGVNHYSLQYAVRKEFKGNKAPFTDAAVEPQLAKFGEITLCATYYVCDEGLSYGSSPKSD